jgi:hypothetical protein
MHRIFRFRALLAMWFGVMLLTGWITGPVRGQSDNCDSDGFCNQYGGICWILYDACRVLQYDYCYNYHCQYGSTDICVNSCPPGGTGSLCFCDSRCPC